jgi:hypothetical protein
VITLTREEAQQLLEVFELFLEEAEDVTTLENNLVKMLRARLAQPEPEPVAWFTEDHREDKSATTYSKKMAGRWKEKGWPVTPLYTAPPQREWQNAALRLGEELSTVGPDGYYNMTAQQWLDWAMKNITPARLAEPYRQQAEAVFAETNGRIRIDPVTGNVGIGWASQPEKNGGA